MSADFFKNPPLKTPAHLQWESEGMAFRLEDIMNQTENKSVLITTDKTSRLKPKPTPITDIVAYFSPVYPKKQSTEILYLVFP